MMCFPPVIPHRERDPPHLWKNEPPSESENQEPEKVHLSIRESLLATRSETGDIHRRFCSARKFRSFNAVKAIPPVCLGVPYISTRNFRFAIEKDSLKELKSDREQALAFHRSSRKSRNTPAIGEFFAPAYFDAGSLPTSANLPSLGLLPPLHPAGISSVETDEDLDGLSDSPEPGEPESTSEEPEITTEEPTSSE